MMTDKLLERLGVRVESLQDHVLNVPRYVQCIVDNEGVAIRADMQEMMEKLYRRLELIEARLETIVVATSQMQPTKPEKEPLLDKKSEEKEQKKQSRVDEEPGLKEPSSPDSLHHIQHQDVVVDSYPSPGSDPISQWHFPVTPCWAMWSLWFHGDKVKDIKPYRLLNPLHMNDDNATLFVQAKAVMDRLIAIAIDDGLAESMDDIASRDQVEFRSVFDMAFDVLVLPSADEDCEALTYLQVFQRLTSREDEDGEVDGSSSGTLGPTTEPFNLALVHDKDDKEYLEDVQMIAAREVKVVDWPLPVTTCRTMWLLWFKGDSQLKLGPLRHFEASELMYAKDKLHLQAARRLMNALAAYAVASGQMQSIELIELLEEAELKTLFMMCWKDFVFDMRASLPQDISEDWLYMDVAVFIDLPQLPPPKQSRLTVEPSTVKPEVFQGTKFQWSDGSNRSVPEGWTFQATSCFEMWHLWFHGDAARGICPFRLLRAADARPTKNFHRARRVMKLFIDIAISRGVATDADAIGRLSSDALSAVFYQSLDVILDHPSDYLVADKLPHKRGSCSYHTFFRYLKRNADGQLVPMSAGDGPVEDIQDDEDAVFAWSDGSIRRAPEGWRFPSLVCSALWVRWFRGDASQGVGPFRRLHRRDVANGDIRSQAETVMSNLIHAAMELGLIASVDALAKLPLPQAIDIFDQTFRHAIRQWTPQEQSRAHGMHLEQFYRTLTKKRKREDE
ncbi:hypothetical protein Ae201684P_018084 [Aphanomyces euteiches]|uniref:Uncharacterized protein n=1 Tax=Aphanomyces euteiches TaxID=100861 RepID=A0A6G0X3D5_9STRA|nr:hypothetical protein Ae201684_008885 [Aphanomyces euteiches]KAH9054363.1 hypothetical protein Ae201684P_018084 [Aphanomyces euteiches]